MTDNWANAPGRTKYRLHHLRVGDIALGPLQILEVKMVRSSVVGWRQLLITRLRRESILAASPDASAKEPEQERNAAAGETQEGQERRGPLVVEAVVHLLGEEYDSGGGYEPPPQEVIQPEPINTNDWSVLLPVGDKAKLEATKVDGKSFQGQGINILFKIRSNGGTCPVFC